MGSPGGSDGKESTCNVRDLNSIPVLRRSPGGGAWQPTPVFLPGESHGQRSLAAYSPWGHKESDTGEGAEQAHTGYLYLLGRKLLIQRAWDHLILGLFSDCLFPAGLFF